MRRGNSESLPASRGAGTGGAPRCGGFHTNLSYANSVRGKQRKQEVEPIPTVLEPVISSEAFRRNSARMIQKVYEVSPLLCPRCKKEMRVVAVIDNVEVIRRILEHLGLWLANARPTPKAHSPPHLYIDHAYSQLPPYEEDFSSQVTPWDSDF